MAAIPISFLPRSSTSPTLGLAELIAWRDDRVRQSTRLSRVEFQLHPLVEPEKAALRDKNGVRLATASTDSLHHSTELPSTLGHGSEADSVSISDAARKWRREKFWLRLVESVAWSSPFVGSIVASQVAHHHNSRTSEPDLRVYDGILLGGTLLFYLLAVLFALVFSMFGQRSDARFDMEGAGRWYRGSGQEDVVAEAIDDLESLKRATRKGVERRMWMLSGLTIWWLLVEIATVFATTDIL